MLVEYYILFIKYYILLSKIWKVMPINESEQFDRGEFITFEIDMHIYTYSSLNTK